MLAHGDEARQRKEKRARLSFRALSVSGDNASPRWLETQNNRRAIINAAYCFWATHISSGLPSLSSSNRDTHMYEFPPHFFPHNVASRVPGNHSDRRGLGAVDVSGLQ